jgi:hypothetical protein
VKPLSPVASTLSLIFVVSSCATAVRGRKQEVSFWSDPAGASVIVDGTDVGTTPTTAELARHDTHSVRIEKPGYVAYEMTTERIESSTAPMWEVPGLIFPPLMLVVPLDYYLGGMYEIKPTEVTANLIAAPASQPAANAPAPLSSATVTSTSDANHPPAPANDSGGAVSKSQ